MGNFYGDDVVMALTRTRIHTGTRGYGADIFTISAGTRGAKFWICGGYGDWSDDCTAATVIGILSFINLCCSFGKCMAQLTRHVIKIPSYSEALSL